ncbi:hypothetical protein [Pleomorphomonas sp. JP5]|uniref:hypothetical protein n=1 Tax=Pleomorphomonas sp. JP5 TaxID=2942998 RepID=UPI0020440A64|nr:hypothetical protein [Pleomorphomonas sp. JP5]MCM5557065.1 hypothetical protein [Pleomorphomonas sp. JP5]
MRLHGVGFQVLIVAILFMSGRAFAQEPHYKTPEDAISAYMEAVAKQDFQAVISTTAVDKMSENYDFISQAERLQSIQPMLPMPSSTPLLVDLNKIDFTSRFAAHIKFLIYGLMSNNEVKDGITFVTQDKKDIERFFKDIQTKRLSEISLIEIGIPHPSQLESKNKESNFSKVALIYGASERTERVALFSFDGLRYAIGFTLLRYGNDWLIESQTSSLVKTGLAGAPIQVTVDDYQSILR